MRLFLSDWRGFGFRVARNNALISLTKRVVKARRIRCEYEGD